MEKKKTTLSYIICLIALLLFDFLWIKFFMGDLYYKLAVFHLNIQEGKIIVDYLSSALCYVCIYISYSVFFLDYIRCQSLFASLGFAAIFGAVLYGVYAFTARAIFLNFNWQLAIMDVTWGAILFILITLVTYPTLKRRK
jgi:uncharacterized membrane protein